MACSSKNLVTIEVFVTELRRPEKNRIPNLTILCPVKAWIGWGPAVLGGRRGWGRAAGGRAGSGGQGSGGQGVSPVSLPGH